ncbi:MAG TPA: hypothetical protein VK525_20175 [Candidatus Saccharimonadales bacterium]|nr:hypothetical protein [Candidatus Saccharimonadales bacterium]
MKNAKTRLTVFSVTIFLIGTGSALAIFQQPAANQQSQQGQQQGQTDQQKKKQDKNNQDPTSPPAKPPADDSKPAPLFGGTVNLKSSRQTKDSASLGFNGVDPNGQVAKSFLTASPTGADAAKAQTVAGYKVDPAELNKFIQDGSLNPSAAPQKSDN